MQKLGFSAALALCVALSACQSFTAREKVSDPEPGKAQRAEKAMPNDDVHAKAKQASAQVAVPGGEAEVASASHILIRYAGALRTTPDVTRTKEEARKLAEQVLKKVQTSGDFAAVAKQYTEDPSGKDNGGKLGKFPKGRMVPEFDSSLFALQPGSVSGVVETGFGFHIIKREE